MAGSKSVMQPSASSRPGAASPEEAPRPLEAMRIRSSAGGAERRSARSDVAARSGRAAPGEQRRRPARRPRAARSSVRAGGRRRGLGIHEPGSLPGRAGRVRSQRDGRGGRPIARDRPSRSRTAAGRRFAHRWQVFGLSGAAGSRARGRAPTGHRFPGADAPVLDPGPTCGRGDGGRSRSPLRGSPGFAPGSLLSRRPGVRGTRGRADGPSADAGYRAGTVPAAPAGRRPSRTPRRARSASPGRWVTSTTVRPGTGRRIVAVTWSAVARSRCAAGSSASSTGRSASSALASATRCRSPPDTARPCSPTRCPARPAARPARRPAPAASSAAATSSSVAEGLASRMFSASVESNR